MSATTKANISAPPPPRVRLCLGITGHREDNPAFAAHRAEIEIVLTQILDAIATLVEAEPASTAGGIAPTRLYSLLADGTDQLAAADALTRGWELIAPLPFGLALNVAINAHPATAEEARTLLTCAVCNPEGCSAAVQQRADRIVELAAKAKVFALADSDDTISALYLAKMEHPFDARKAATFAAETSLRAALAGKVMIEQADLLIAVWDGATRALVGGTGHTIQVALESGTPVLWINAHEPLHWQILTGPEALTNLHQLSATAAVQSAELQLLLHRVLRPVTARQHQGPHGHGVLGKAGPETLVQETMPRHSNRLWHWYRRIEALFGADSWRGRFRDLRQYYETPDAIATGSAAEFLSHAEALPGQQKSHVDLITSTILRRFAWADGISARLSDTYRGSMMANFLLSPFAIVGGIAYLPFGTSETKWFFSLFELALLVGILILTATGQKQRWHGRWFETRRVAEYLRHAPILLLLGVARPPGRWPQGTETSWPEWYARHSLREVGLPSLTVTQAYLRKALRDLLLVHVNGQRLYHLGKAKRLAAVHHNLDHMSEVMFKLAVLSVAAYLVLRAGGVLHLWSHEIAHDLSFVFTFLGVLLPTFGGAIAGIRYFGDFERFAAISRVTAEKLNVVENRITYLLAAPEGALDYSHVADIAHATDDVVVSEIESWQAVFGGKQVTVPV